MPKLPTLKELLDTLGSLLELKLQIVSLQIQKILHKYSPDQPRVPAGNANGGQWTDGEASGRTRVAGKYDPARAEICDAQLLLDDELCRMAKSARCWSLSMDRYAACMKDNFIPTLRF